MKLILFSAFLFYFQASAFSQLNDSLRFTGDLKKDILLFLKSGHHVYDLMNGIKADPKLNKFSRKMKAAIEKNRDWYIDHVYNSPKGESLPYHKNLGLSEADYSEFLKLAKDVTAISTARVNTSSFALKDHDSLQTVMRVHFIIHTLKLQFTVRFADSVAFYNDLKLKYTGEAGVDNESNGLRSKWKGYRFEYENPSETNSDDFKNEKFNYHSIKITIAILEKGNKTLITIRERKIVDGNETIDTDLPLVYSDNQKIVIR